MNVYLISSESFRLMEDEVAKIINNSINVLTIDLLNTSLEEIVTEATYVSMFEEQKYIIVKNADFFSTQKGKEEEDIELLMKYLENPVKLKTLIFETYRKLDTRKKLTKYVSEHYKVISLANLQRNDLMNKIRDYVMSQKFKINTETINYIIDACYNNYDLIINEINKVFLYYEKEQMINLDDVKNIVSRSLVDNNFKFVEAVVDKDFILATKILEDLYVLKVDPISLLMLLAREYRMMYCVNYLYGIGTRKNEIGKELGLQEWQVDKLLKNVSKYNNDSLLEYLNRLAQYDYLIKSGQMDKFVALKIFLLEIE